MATAPIAERRYTPEDLLAMEGERPSYELLDGQLVERHVSARSAEVVLLIASWLVPFVRPRKLGRLYDSEFLIRIFPDPSRTRKADLSFIAASRAPVEDVSFLRIPPDLVVEVVSPSDIASEVHAKVAELLANGVRMVWVVYPGPREVHVYRANGHPSILIASDEITGEDVVPGFTCSVADFFPEPVATPEAAAE